MTLRVPCKWKHADDYPAVMREHVAMLNALDAPFERSAVLDQGSATGCVGARQRADAPGLVPIENNRTESKAVSEWAKPAKGARLIDGAARRCKRMRLSVEHSMRLSESGLSHRGGFRFRRKFVTLTYAKVDDWAPDHINDYLRRVRKWAARRKFTLRFVWVAELQDRGAVHYHVTFWIPSRHKLPFADAQGWWTHGSSNLKPITGGCVGVMAYMAKYMSKMTGAAAMAFPKGARMHGAGGLDAEQKREVRYRLAPFWVKDELGTYADIRRTVGGWLDRVTGLFLRSPWKVLIDHNGLTWAVRVPLGT